MSDDRRLPATSPLAPPLAPRLPSQLRGSPSLQRRTPSRRNHLAAELEGI